MLEVTILKTKHAGADEARKLRPFIQNCDIFSIEQAGWTEEMCLKFDTEYWRELLSGSRTGAKDYVTRRYARNSKGERDYGLTLMDDIYRSKRLLWSAERFQTNEPSLGPKKFLELQNLQQMALQCLVTGKAEEFLRFQRAYFDNTKAGVEERDREIARNIDCSESAIRTAYPELKEKEPLCWAIQIGLAHSPEKYAKRQVKVVEFGDLIGRDMLYLKENLSDVDLVKYGIALVVESGLIKRTPEMERLIGTIK